MKISDFSGYEHGNDSYPVLFLNPFEIPMLKVKLKCCDRVYARIRIRDFRGNENQYWRDFGPTDIQAANHAHFPPALRLRFLQRSNG